MTTEGGLTLQQVWDIWMHRPRVFEADVCGRPVRTAPHLIAFRDWLVEQTVKFVSREFVNATGGCSTSRASR